MKNKTLLLIPLLAILLAGCSDANNQNSNSNNNSGEITNPGNPNDENPNKEMLPIGNTSVSGPKNLANPVDITDYTTFTFNNEMPENFSYIQGNNKVSQRGDFYSTGAFKFHHLYYGFQTCAFNTWNKLEIRLKIAEVHNSSQKADKKKPPFMHVYGYNNEGKFIYQYNLEQGRLEFNTQEIKFYIENQPSVSYLEFRLNAYPFKGSQCYNFGVSSVMIKGWPRV